MRCPYCGESETKVVDSREITDQTRRRRECEKCSKRFTTYERVENLDLNVIKKDGSKQAFDSQKIKQSIIKACAKRPITLEEIDRLVEYVEYKVKSFKTGEVSTAKIGAEVMKKLAKLDKVAYLRFASVYKDFKNIQEFEEEISKLEK